MRPSLGSRETGAVRRPFPYRWVIVAAAIVLLAGLSGAQLSFGVFLRPVSEDLGWTNAAISGAMSLCVGIAGLTGVFMGRFTDKHDVRIVIAIGTLAGVAGHLLLATVGSLWLFYLFFGVGVGICAGCSYTPANATVSKWFPEEKRALALGIALTGMVVGQTVLAPGISRVIEARGWRFAYLMLAVVVLVCGVVSMLLMGRKPEGTAGDEARPAPGTRAGDPTTARNYTAREAARTAPFWMLVVTGIVMSVAFYILIAHTVDCAEGLGLSKDAASLILTVSGLGSLAGTLAAAALVKLLSGRWALCALLAVQAVFTFLFMSTTKAWSFYLVSGVVGFCYGAAIPVRMAMVPPLFGIKAVGAILGWATLAWAVGGVVGPYFTGYIYDATQSYDMAFLVGGVLLLVGAASVFFWGRE